jgi:hypothetical protein
MIVYVIYGGLYQFNNATFDPHGELRGVRECLVKALRCQASQMWLLGLTTRHRAVWVYSLFLVHNGRNLRGAQNVTAGPVDSVSTMR